MKRTLLALVLLLPMYAQAIPVVIGPSISQSTIIGYKEVTHTYWGWGGGPLHIFGHKKKHIQVPIYGIATPISITPSVPAVPEPSTWLMVLIGMGLVALRLRKRPNV